MKSTEVRRLKSRWDSRTAQHWPKFLEWIEIRNIRGWHEQRIDLRFPLVAIVGENGSGKSTVLQAAACSYINDQGDTYFPTEFFPETAWDRLQDVGIRVGYQQGPHHETSYVRKPTTRWLGQPDRPRRAVRYLDLSRLQPVGTRVGYARIAKTRHQEQGSVPFDDDQISRMSAIMGRDYHEVRMATSDIDPSREIPILTKEGDPYSGFHQGSGETTIAELLQTDLPRNGLIVIDEIESSLHPRAQRRLVRDLATAARLQECQIILSTHSPYVLEELPLEARIYILESNCAKQIVNGVSPQFAMTKMDDENHPEAEVFVEDEMAKIWLTQIISRFFPDYLLRVSIVPYGAANLGMALGQINHAKRFQRPTIVVLDGDQGESTGCIRLPGGDAPERVVFTALQAERWRNLWTRVQRDISATSDACNRAMLEQDHHNWVRLAANELMLGGDVLWQAMCSEWTEITQLRDVQYIRDELIDRIG